MAVSRFGGRKFFNHVKFMRTALVLFFTFLIVRLLYRWRAKQEKVKVGKLKDFILQQTSWASPKFNNGGFVVGIFMFLLGLFSIFLYFRSSNNGMPLGVTIGLTLFGLFMVYGTPFIRITKEQIIFQSLLFKLLGLSFSEKMIPFNEIKNISVKQVMPPFNALVINTKSAKKFKLNTALFNSEIGNAIYEVTLSRLSG